MARPRRTAQGPPGTSDRAGTFRRVTAGGETYYTFHPRALPPDPPLNVDPSVQERLDAANQALGRLDGVTLLLPDPDQFLYSYIRKEAVLSSQIEGTQSSLSDLLLFEHDVAPSAPMADVRETSNYIRAMNHGLERIEGGFPLSVRLICEIHEHLLEGTRGSERAPGEFRTTQNWIGGTRPGNARFVPPPAHEVLAAVGALETFLHDRPVQTPILIKAALAHAQFETIHPFLDGNGRVGRLLITLLLCSREDASDRPVLSQPLLYLSLFLKKNRDAYYEALQRIRLDGAWEDWLGFFLEGVIEVAESATRTTQEIVQLVEEDRARVRTLGRAAGSAALLHELAVSEIVLTLPRAAARLGVSPPTVGKAAANLERIGVLEELTGRSRGRLYAYRRYLALLSEGT